MTFKNKYWFILVAQVFMLFVAAVMHHHFSLTALFVLSLLLIFGSVIKMICTSVMTGVLAVLSAVVALTSGLMWWLVPGISGQWIHVSTSICCFSYAVFILIAMITIGRHVFITDNVTADQVVGSICLYMLIGMFFGFIYAGIAVFFNDSFVFSQIAMGHDLVSLREFLYFSYSTLTTIGYGDIVPLAPVPRLLACLEGVSGSVYLAIMVARLVGMHVIQSRRSNTTF